MSDSDYDVEEYVKPTIVRTTYDKEEEETHISEQEDEDEDDKSETSSEKSEEVFDCSKREVNIEPEEIKVIEKKPAKVEEIEPRTSTSCRLILHVSNLSAEVTKSMLEALFMDAGEIKSIRLPKRRAKNLAFVEMKDMDGYKNALTLDGKVLDEKPIRIQHGSKNKKHSTRASRSKRKAPKAKNEIVKKKKYYK